MSDTATFRRERVHRCPMGRCFFLPATAHGKLAVSSSTKAKQEQVSWRSRSIHPNLLALTGEPAEAFCLVPDPAELPALFYQWSLKCPTLTRVLGADIDSAMAQAAAGRPWLCRWVEGQPAGLFHWSYRSSRDVTPLNGGSMFTRYVWATFSAEGDVSAIRVSRSSSVSTPPGMALCHPGYDWSFIERSWSAQDDHEVTICHGINLSDPLHPTGMVKGRS